MSNTTSVSDWKKNESDIPLELPSGKAIRVRRPGFQAFMKTGIIPNSLLGIVQNAMEKGQDPSADDLKDIIGDPKKVAEMMEMVDEVVVFCAFEPSISRVPTKSSDRKDDLLYVDEIDDEDKMFIFQWVTGGTRDLEQFRHGVAASLAPLSAG